MSVKVSTEKDEKRASVSAEKAFELETNIIRDEINRRLEFERRLINLQLILVGIITTAYASGRVDVTPFYADSLCAAIIIINSVFSIETRQNIHHIAMASLYARRVINSKYVATGLSENKILEWEIFLNVMRTKSKRFFINYQFYLSAGFLASLYLLLAPLLWYIVTIYGCGIMRIFPISAVIIFIASGITVIIWWVAFVDSQSIKDWEDTYSQEFQLKYMKNMGLEEPPKKNGG